MRSKFQSVVLAAVLVVIPGLVVVTSASPAAAATDPTCAGAVTAPCLYQGFEIDGDTLVDGGGIDWKSSPEVVGSPALTTFSDPVSSGADNSFQQGSKENDQSTWTCGTGSVPSKDDFAGGQIWFQTVNGTQYLYGNFTRESPNGSAHIDYEFNKASNSLTGTCTGLPVRQSGDILIAFDTNNGGATITVTAYRYATSGWTQIATGANQFAGATNIPVPPFRTDPGVTKGTFGEAGLDLTHTVGTFTCGEFGAAWMKNRAAVGGGSGLVTDGNAALKDYTTPQKINTGNCPTSTLTKGVRDHSTNPNGTYTTSVNASPGDTIDYQLVYDNKGAAPATNVTVSDPIPAHETYVAGSCQPATCTVSGGNISWPAVSSVGVNSPQTYTFSVTLDPSFSAPADISNIATVTTAEEGTTKSNQADVNVAGSPNLSITKTADNSSVTSPATIGYTITAKNTGTGDASGVKITDTLPTNAGLSWTIDQANSGSGCSISAGVLTCNVGTLAALTGTFKVHITSTTQGVCGTVSNKASLSATGVTTVDSGALTVITVNCPSSSLAKGVRNITTNTPAGTTSYSSTSVSASPGNTIGYQLVYTNTGNVATTGVVVSDPIPAHTTYVAGSCVPNTCTVSNGTISWPAATVAANGGTLTDTFSVTIDSTFPQGSTPVSNTGSVTTDQTGTTPSNPTTVNVTANPALHITKTADNASVTLPGSIGYTIEVTNTGNASASNVVITDNLPTGSGFSWSVNKAGCSITSNVLTCNIATLAAHTGDFSVDVTSTTNQQTCGTVQNHASVSADGVTSIDSSTATITVNCPGSSLAKGVRNITTNTPAGSTTYASSVGASPGDTIGYQIVYTNTGNVTTTGVVVSDPIPAHTTYVAGSCVPNTCTVSNGTISWPAATVTPNGGQLTDSFSVTLDSTFPQGSTPVTNTASVTTNQTGTTPSNPTTVTVTANPALGITKTADNSTVNNNGTIGYTIEVKNTGDADASNVVITDTLPTNPGLNWSVNKAGCSISSGVLTCTIASLPAHTGDFTVDVTSTTTSATCGTVQNQAFVKADGVTQINSGTATVITVTCPGHTLVKGVRDITTNTPNDGTYLSSVGANPGDTIGYQLSYTNTGNGPATNVVISDPIPAHETYVAGSCVPSNCTVSNGTISWPAVASVAPNATVTDTFRVTLDSTFPQGSTQLQNVATITTDQTGTTPSNPTTVNVTANPVLVITKTADKASVNDTDQIGYTIEVKNTGDADATNVVITDTLPTNPGLNWSVDEAGCSISSGVLTCNIETLPAHTGDFTVDVTSTTTQQSCGTVQNQAFVKADGVTQISSGPLTVISVNCAAVSISKTADNSTVSSGNQVGYTLTVTNTGAGDAYNVMVTDTLPNSIAGLSWSLSPANTPSGCSVSSGNPQVLTCDLGTIPAGSPPIVIHVVSPTPASTCGTLSNSATVTSDNGGGNTTGPVIITVPLSTAGASTNGSSYGLNVNVLGKPLLLDHVGQVSSSAPPNGNPAANNLLVVPSLLGVVSANVVNTTSASHVNGFAGSTATSTIAHINLLGGAITADTIQGVSQSVATPSTATYDSIGSTFANLKINGKSVLNVSPNTSVNVYLVGTKILLARAVLYEESGTSGLNNGMWSASHSVTMLDITLVQGLGALPAGAQITVAHAQTDATYPSGLGCGFTANTVSGNAYTAYANGTALGTTLVNAQVGDAELPPTGGSNTDDIAAVNLAPLAKAGAGVNYTVGQTTSTPVTATSGSNVANVNLLNGLVTADAIDVKSSSSATASSASTTFGATCANNSCPKACATSSPCFVNLAVGGHSIVGINGGTVPPNTVIAVPQSDGSLLEVILNEQVASSGGGNTQGDINAIHVYLFKGSGLLSAEVIVGHAHSDAHHA